MQQDDANRLINHVLYDEKWKGIDGKDGWTQFQCGLITKRELRILLMQHSATKISHSNKSQEPSYDSYLCKDICQKFEVALLGEIEWAYKSDQPSLRRRHGLATVATSVESNVRFVAY
jgi:hypothetical protein